MFPETLVCLNYWDLFHDPTTSRVLTVKEIVHCKFFVLVIYIFFYKISLFRTNFQFLVGLFISSLFSFSVLYYSRQYPSIRNRVGNFSLILQILFFQTVIIIFAIQKLLKAQVANILFSYLYLLLIPVPISWRGLSASSHNRLMKSGLMFSSLIHVEFNFVLVKDKDGVLFFQF